MAGRSVPLPLVVALMTASVLVGSAVGPGVSAAFTSSTGGTTGTLSMATLAGMFANGTNDVGATGGTGGSSYVMNGASLALVTSVRRYTTLTHAGTVQASYGGALTAQGLSGTLTVAVDACTVAWAAGLCGGSTSSLLAATSVATNPSVSYGTLAVSGLKYLRFTLTAGSATASATTVTAAATPTAPRGDRTAG